MSHLSAYEVASLALAILTVVLIPLMAILIRLVIRGTRFEAKLDHSIAQLNKHITDSDKVHAELAATAREDRRASNERLTWLERNLWRRQGRGQVT